MSDTFTAQGSLAFEAGGKLGEHVFLGGFGSIGVGGISGAGCTESCTTLRFGGGPEIHYVFTPAARHTPWLGLSAGGIQAAIAHGGRGSAERQLTLTGYEIAHAMAGWDVRFGRVFGLGAFVDFLLGVYPWGRISTENGTVVSGEVKEPALHAWLTAGLRGVLFP